MHTFSIHTHAIDSTSFRVVSEHNAESESSNSMRVRIWISLLFLHWHHFAIYFSVLLIASRDMAHPGIHNQTDFSVLFSSHQYFVCLARHRLYYAFGYCVAVVVGAPNRHDTLEIYVLVLNHVCQKKPEKKKCDITFSTVFTMQRHHLVHKRGNQHNKIKTIGWSQEKLIYALVESLERGSSDFRRRVKVS